MGLPAMSAPVQRSEDNNANSAAGSGGNGNKSRSSSLQQKVKRIYLWALLLILLYLFISWLYYQVGCDFRYKIMNKIISKKLFQENPPINALWIARYKIRKKFHLRKVPLIFLKFFRKGTRPESGEIFPLVLAFEVNCVSYIALFFPFLEHWVRL